MTFRTDDSVAGSGFQLSYEQERESCSYANLHLQLYNKYLLLQLLLSSLSLMSRVKLAPTSVFDVCVTFFVIDPVLLSSPQTVFTPIPRYHSSHLFTPAKSFRQSSHLSLGLPILLLPSTLGASVFFVKRYPSILSTFPAHFSRLLSSFIVRLSFRCQLHYFFVSTILAINKK